MKWLRWLFGGKPRPARRARGTAVSRERVRERIHWRLHAADDLVEAFSNALGLGSGFHEFGARIAEMLRGTGTCDWLQLQFHRTTATENGLKVLADSPAGDRVELLALASLSHNGFVREAAVHEIARLGEVRSLRYLMPRLGDWVEQVRTAALAACLDLLPRASADALLAIAGDFEQWLAARSNEATRTIRARIDEELSGRHWAAVRSVLFTPAAGHRGVVRRLCMRTQRLDGDALRRLVRDPEAATRQAIAPLAGLRVNELDTAVVDGVLGDSVPVVVARFVAGLQETAVVAFAERLKPLCFGRSALIRRVVCTRLASVGWSAADECRRRLAGSPSDASAGAILCLAESGGREDRVLLAPYTEHAVPSVRAAALCALGRVDAEGCWPLAVEWLASRHAVERHAARDVLHRVSRELWIENVRSLAASDDQPVRAAAFRALTHDAVRRGWTSVPDLLGAILVGHSPVQSWGRLRGWCLRNLARGWLRADAPTRAVLQDVWQRWRAVNPAIPADMNELFGGLSRWIDEELAKSP